MPRPYRLQRRAERQDETRQRIVESVVALHQERGLVETTVSAVAERAGVRRATVYRHFPDERSLIAACIGHYYAEHPLPDAESWTTIPEPVERLRRALTEIYAYHRETAPMLSQTLPEVPRKPVVVEVLRPVLDYWQHVCRILVAGWPDGETGLDVRSAAVGHAIAFDTWKSLVKDQRLDEARAVELMVNFVSIAAQVDRATDEAPEASQAATALASLTTSTNADPA